MNITPAELEHQLMHTFGYRRYVATRRDLDRHAGAHPHVQVPLVLGIFSRETNMQNEVGDGGHGRGIAQVDDRFNAVLLRSVRGCRNLSYLPIFGSCLPAGRVPTLRTAVVVIVRSIEAGIKFAERNGVGDGHRLHFAVSAYNAGEGGALSGYRHGDSDKYTTGHDYAADVIARATAIRRILFRLRW